MPKPKSGGVNGNYNEILRKIATGEAVNESDWKITDKMVRGINERQGGCTFDFQTALRILLTHKEKRENEEKDAQEWEIPRREYEKIKSAFLSYRFFMTMPGEDSMVLWSENLQIQLAVNEYFTAYLFEGEVFSADKKKSGEHLRHAESRINIWLKQRWLYGFSEWNSPTYYVEDISPLCLIIDFFPCEKTRERAKIILDLLLYDIAVGQFRGIFSSTSGRCYPNGRKIAELDKLDGENRMSLYNSIGSIIDELVDCSDDLLSKKNNITLKKGSPNGILGNFKYRKKDGYLVPQVIKLAASGKLAGEFKTSQGLNLYELKEKNLIGQGDAQIMQQWAMESFTNPETLKNTIKYCRKNNLFNNANFRELKYFNLPLLHSSPLLPALSKKLNLFTNGIVLERANTYTYKTKYLLQSTAQMYSPASHGAQQHIWTVNFALFAVFAANPYSRYGTGGYWTGDGVKPYAAQDRNITLALYDTRVKGVKIRKINDYTHAYFPAALFDKTDEAMLCEGMIFGEINGAFIALITKNPLEFLAEEMRVDKTDFRHNLVQKGSVTYWICETSDCENETFDCFKKRIMQNKVEFDGKALSYYSSNKKYTLSKAQTFSVDDTVQNLEYKRFESDLIVAQRESEKMYFNYAGETLLLDFNKAERKMKRECSDE